MKVIKTARATNNDVAAGRQSFRRSWVSKQRKSMFCWQEHGRYITDNDIFLEHQHMITARVPYSSGQCMCRSRHMTASIASLAGYGGPQKCLQACTVGNLWAPSVVAPTPERPALSAEPVSRSEEVRFNQEHKLSESELMSVYCIQLNNLCSYSAKSFIYSKF